MIAKGAYRSVTLRHTSQNTKGAIGDENTPIFQHPCIILIAAHLEKAGTRSSDEVLQRHNEHFVARIGAQCYVDDVMNPLWMRRETGKNDGCILWVTH